MPPGSTIPDDALDSLLDHCLAARAIIGERGSPTTRRLIDLLLFEVGVEIAKEIKREQEGPRRDGTG